MRTRTERPHLEPNPVVSNETKRKSAKISDNGGIAFGARKVHISQESTHELVEIAYLS